jgi:hypothetical protein
MPFVKVNKHKVDVSYPECGPNLPCFCLGFDKGTFVQGRGYTKYYDKELPVCWTRHSRGCPDVGICLDCRTIASPVTLLRGKCGWCGGVNIEKRNQEGAP